MQLCSRQWGDHDHKRIGSHNRLKKLGKKALPTWAKSSPPTHTVDVGRALLMLGSMSTPNGLSAGSPERYWACIRYFSACTPSADLRIRTPFMDLDPHQKGILSDDFGVGISTSWLVDQLGGVRDIVDGRQFIINMGVIEAATGKRLPKVGRQKCPDFILEDHHGKLHVLECKGTQSGRGYLERAMRTGMIQKRGIRVAKALRGESLVIGLSLAGEGEDRDSELVVIDPEDEPLTVVRESEARKATEILTRLSLARALNLNGFSLMAFEIAWPETLKRNSAEVELLTPSERKSLSVTQQDRQRGWLEEFRTEFSSVSNRMSEDFVTQQMSFDLSALLLDSGDIARRVTVRRGLQGEVIERLARAGGDLRMAASELSASIAAEHDIVEFSQTAHSARVAYRNLFFSEIVFD